MKNTTLTHSIRRFRSAIAGLALLGFAQLGIVQQAHAAANPVSVQTAEVHALLTSVHELTSYNGDEQTAIEHLAAWEQLWAEDSTFSVNGGAPIEGRDAIMAFFAGAGFFNFSWIGLTPSFRAEVAIHGETAEVYLECIFLDEAKAVKAERSLSGTIRKSGGKWLFWRMFTDPAEPLFP